MAGQLPLTWQERILKDPTEDDLNVQYAEYVDLLILQAELNVRMGKMYKEGTTPLEIAKPDRQAILDLYTKK